LPKAVGAGARAVFLATADSPRREPASSYVRCLNCNGTPSACVVTCPLNSNNFSGALSREGDKKGISIEPSHWYAGKCWPSAFVVLGAITFCHLLNDVMQALLPAIYPMLKSGFALSFGQIGLLTLIFQVTASLLQPMVGLSLTADRSLIRYSWVWLVRCSAWSRSPSRQTSLRCSPERHCLASAVRYFIPNLRVSPDWPRAVLTVSPNLFFSSWRPCRKCTRTAIGCIRCPAART
jgi:hypothetical protein